VIRSCFALLCLLALAACEPVGIEANSAPAAESLPRGEGFDFYVLALSWSPSYCQAEGEDANPQQCKASRPYAFVVHGLWPQYENGYPENCPTAERSVSGRIVRSMLDLMPSAGMVRHQWRRHGSCTGLSQEDYFRVVRQAAERVAIPGELQRRESPATVSPDEIEKAFLRVNPDLAADAMAVTCDRRYLREVRICMTRELDFRSCPQVDRKGCRKPALMPPVR
jgi:ribonuclease T2